ncbi:MAG: O-antigen ligase family protein [Chitinophagaceae bacterium]
MLTSFKYDEYKGRYRVGLVVFFLLLTATFGYLSHDYNEESRNYGQLLIIGVVINVILAYWLKVKLDFKFPFSPVIYSLIVWLFLIQFFRENLELSNKNFINILFTQVFVIVISKIFWQIPLERLINIFIIYLHLTMIVSAYVHVKNGGPLELGNHDEFVRMGGLFFFGITGVLAGLGAILSSLMYFRSEGLFTKSKYLVSTLIFMTWTLACDMRTVMAGIVVAIFIQLLFKRKAQNKSVMPLILLAGLFYWMIKLYKSYSEGTDLDKDVETREILWSIGRKLIAEQPLFGYGNYQNDLGRVSVTDIRYGDLFNAFRLTDPHSSYLSLMIQSGLLSFGIFVFFLIKILFLSKKFNPYSRALLSIIGFWLICGSTGGNFFDFTYTLQGLLFELTVFGMILHPGLIESPEYSEPGKLPGEPEFGRTLEPNAI